MNQPWAQSPALSLEKRRADIMRVQEQQVQLHRITGTVEIVGAGEVLVSIPFPVTFAEKPSVFFGGEMAENQVIVATKFPSISAIVYKWVTYETPGSKYYRGASIIVVTTGSADQRVNLQWHAEGKAFRNPVFNVDDVSGTI